MSWPKARSSDYAVSVKRIMPLAVGSSAIIDEQHLPLRFLWRDHGCTQ
jgi:hypothetical protein